MLFWIVVPILRTIKVASSLKKRIFCISYIVDKFHVFEEQSKHFIYVGEFFFSDVGPPFMFQFSNVCFSIAALWFFMNILANAF